MDEKPNPADFSVNEKPNEYEVCIRVDGVIRRTISAASHDDAMAQAEALADDISEDLETAELDEVDDLRVVSCRKTPPMYRVLRDGKIYQVGRLEPGDLPREPDEWGF